MGANQAARDRLKYAAILTAAILIVELVGGIFANSLALVSDAGHLFADLLALGLSWYGVRQAVRPANAQMTYGYHRVGILTAVVNAVSLVGISGFIFFEASRRFMEPPEVRGLPMLVLAAVGLGVNFVVVTLLLGHRDSSLSLRSAFLHVIGDTLGSIGVIAGAVVILTTGFDRVDPLVSVAIGLVLLYGAWGILKDGMRVFLEAAPGGMKLDEVAQAISEVPEVKRVHDLHVWSISRGIPALSCHVLIDDLPASKMMHIQRCLQEMLKERFNIDHSTVQFEVGTDGEESLFCILAPEEAHRGAGKGPVAR